VSTIRQRLTLRLLSGWALLLLLGGGLGYWLAATALTRQFDETLRAKAASLAMLIEQEDGGRLNIDASETFLREFGAHPGTAFFQLWDAGSNVVVRSQSLRNASLPLGDGTVSKPRFQDLDLPGDLSGRAAIFKFKPRPSDDAKPPAVLQDAFLAVATERQGLNRTLAILRLVLAACGALILVLTATVLPLLLRRELAPIHGLAAQAEQIDAASLSSRFPVEGLPQELKPISQTLNDLLERLQTAFERERQFSDDLAHEFRTPLAELRSLTELSLKWPDTRTPQTDQQMLSIALQMQNIIDRLLAIARTEQGRLPVQLEKLNLAELILAVQQTLAPRALSRRITMEWALPSSIQIASDPVLLRSILTNLIENAVEYAPAGSSVRIEASAPADRFHLRITNPAGHLSSEDVTHLFDRFWRKDSARSHSGHAGLGLSLARASALSLGYALDASLDACNCLTMALSGPLNQNNHDNQSPAREAREKPG
jgi:two-component system, OmpR family, heavy metal sensor histidine kinase CusS